MKKGLGKGLNSLLGADKIKLNDVVLDEKQSENKDKKNDNKKSIADNEVIYIEVSDIEPNLSQPRKRFDKEKLEELALSIKEYGIIQPILVKKNGKKYEIIAGERRFRAAIIANVDKIPVIIKEYTDKLSKEVAIIENIQRADLNPIEEAMAYQSLIEEYNLTQEEVAKRVSKNRSTITNVIRLLKLDKEVQELLVSEKITQGHARSLLATEDCHLQRKIANDIVKYNLTVREVEKLLKPKKEKIKKELSKNDIFVSNYEDILKEILGTRVTINQKDKDKGRIEIEYYSLLELERILELIGSIKELQ